MAVCQQEHQRPEHTPLNTVKGNVQQAVDSLAKSDKARRPTSLEYL